MIYYPDYPNALILKSELLKKAYENALTEKGEKNFLKPKDGELKKKFENLKIILQCAPNWVQKNAKRNVPELAVQSKKRHNQKATQI